MKYIVLLIFALFTIGCDSRTRLNPGSDRAVYIGSTDHFFKKIPPGIHKSDHIVLGYYDIMDGSITLHEQLRGMGLARIFARELARAYDFQKPRSMRDLLERYQSVDFDFHLYKVSP